MKKGSKGPWLSSTNELNKPGINSPGPTQANLKTNYKDQNIMKKEASTCQTLLSNPQHHLLSGLKTSLTEDKKRGKS